MKIIHVSTARSWRGGEQQLAYLQQELAAVWQMILCPTGSAMEEYCTKNNVRHLAIPKKSALDFGFARRLAQLAREHQALVHVHDSHAHTFAVLAAVFHRMKNPVVVHRRVAFRAGTSYMSRYKYQHPVVKKVICISEKVKEVVAPVLRDESLAVVIHSGIDLSRFANPDKNYLRKELNLPSGKKIIGTVAAFTAEKDLPTFVRCAEELLQQREDLHFVLIGTGNMFEEIKKLISDKNLQDNFTLPGFRSDVDKLLPGLDIFLFTSREEGFGTSLLDAFAAGVPVVTTKVGGIPEIVENGKNGFLAQTGDHQALVKQVLQLLNDEKLRQKFQKEALVSVQHFDKKQMAERTLQLYRELQ